MIQQSHFEIVVSKGRGRLMAACTVNVVPADGGERLVAGPVVHRVLEDGSSTGGRLGLLGGRYPPRWARAPPPVAPGPEETFYFLGGALRVRSCGKDPLLAARGLFPRPTGVPAGAGAASPDP